MPVGNPDFIFEDHQQRYFYQRKAGKNR